MIAFRTLIASILVGIFATFASAQVHNIPCNVAVRSVNGVVEPFNADLRKRLEPHSDLAARDQIIHEYNHQQMKKRDNDFAKRQESAIPVQSPTQSTNGNISPFRNNAKRAPAFSKRQNNAVPVQDASQSTDGTIVAFNKRGLFKRLA